MTFTLLLYVNMTLLTLGVWIRMSDERIKTIIKEITYWKKHKLLPDVYCDYLLALYTQGEDEELLTSKENQRVVKIIEIVRISLIFLMLLLTFVIVYLIDMNILLQTVLFIIILIFSSWMYILLGEKRDINFPYAIAILLSLYFLSSIHLTTLYIKNHWLLYGVLFTNFFVWFFLSVKKQLNYLKIISMIATIFTVFYIIFRYFIS